MTAPFRQPHVLSGADEFLVDIAVKIQLPPGLYALALERYQTIAEWMERSGSPLEGKIDQVHAQGSVMVGSTIRCWRNEDLFDLDMIAELIVASSITPKDALDLVEDALAGAEGSRYWAMTERKTRCITVEYAEMHIDVTPLVRVVNSADRVGHIFHAKEGTPASTHRKILANPWGFGRWYTAQTPPDDWFGNLLLERSIERGGLLAKGADVEQPPEQKAIYRKSRATVALQLIKRHVQVLYHNRGDVRRPPSVALTCVVGQNARGDRSLLDEIIHQAVAIRKVFVEAHALSAKAEIRNPTLQQDHFTDRWPENLDVQRQFITDLERFIAALVKARDAQPDELAKIFAVLFGERVTEAVLVEKADRERRRLNSVKPLIETKSGRVLTSVAPIAATVVTPRPQTYFGGDDME